jgi:V/A-type H+/Na+-transporting ATPase subunit B
VLSAEMQARGVYPPFEALSSLSRLMRNGAGPGRTRSDHLAVSSQVFAGLARAREVRELEEMVGAEALSETDQSYLRFASAIEHTMLDQRRDESRSMGDTLDRAWQALALLPRRELTMLSSEVIDENLPSKEALHETAASAG